MSDTSLSREQLLDEIDFLATVEHALVVEYLSLYCVFGEQLLPAEAAASPPLLPGAADMVHGLAVSEMRHLHQLNQLLVLEGRSAQVGRASSIGPPGAEIPLGPQSAAQLENCSSVSTGSPPP